MIIAAVCSNEQRGSKKKPTTSLFTLCTVLCVLFHIVVSTNQQYWFKYLAESQTIRAMKIQIKKTNTQTHPTKPRLPQKTRAKSARDNPNEFVYTLLNIQSNIITLVAIPWNLIPRECDTLGFVRHKINENIKQGGEHGTNEALMMCRLLYVMHVFRNVCVYNGIMPIAHISSSSNMKCVSAPFFC